MSCHIRRDRNPWIARDLHRLLVLAMDELGYWCWGKDHEHQTHSRAPIHRRRQSQEDDRAHATCSSAKLRGSRLKLRHQASTIAYQFVVDPVQDKGYRAPDV